MHVSYHYMRNGNQLSGDEIYFIHGVVLQCYVHHGIQYIEVAC